MTEPDFAATDLPTTIRATVTRRTVVGAAWAAPVVALAVTAPGAAASDLRPLLSGRADGPTEYPESGSSVFGVYVTNTGPDPIPAGALAAILNDSDPRYSFSGVSGLQWDYSDSFPDGKISFSYLYELAPGEESGILLLLIDSNDRSQVPTPVADLILTAPGFRAGTVALSIVY
ncbi:hypothetical protein [Herbiconiux sp. YIM B11900]|uniref:hypothetical protein n=1 Tax=Herbiconiux sp. YIM B11900 TaxID=3404131 RepID=UPI003F8491D9